jgi:hypothetical protein
MKRFIAVFLAALIMACMLAPAAFADEAEYAYDTEYYSKFKGQSVTLYVYNWGEYISDGSDDSMDVIAEFEALTGINVEYTTFDSNESLFASNFKTLSAASEFRCFKPRISAGDSEKKATSDDDIIADIISRISVMTIKKMVVVISP